MQRVFCYRLRAFKLQHHQFFWESYCAAGGLYDHAVIVNNVPFIIAN